MSKSVLVGVASGERDSARMRLELRGWIRQRLQARGAGQEPEMAPEAVSIGRVLSAAGAMTRVVMW